MVGLALCAGAAVAVLAQSTHVLGQSPAAVDGESGTSTPRSHAGAETFATADEAANALVAAARKFDVARLLDIFGPDGRDIVQTGEPPLDRQRAADFAAQASDRQRLVFDPKTRTRATLIVGAMDWPFPVPIRKRGDRWSFDTAAGREEILNRRIGGNELDAIEICHDYVDAQEAYAFRPRKGFDVNQYAQRIISSPGTQDGLAWKNSDGTWGGPIGEEAASAIERGYREGDPFHGYFFKVLKGQGPAAPLGALNYVIDGVMIGGFALAAAPAQYRQTGVMTFIVSNKGVVFQKDLGPNTLHAFKAMTTYNPDKSWKPVPPVTDSSQ
jgi:hypothetical protein